MNKLLIFSIALNAIQFGIVGAIWLSNETAQKIEDAESRIGAPNHGGSGGFASQAPLHRTRGKDESESQDPVHFLKAFAKNGIVSQSGRDNISRQIERCSRVQLTELLHRLKDEAPGPLNEMIARGVLRRLAKVDGRVAIESIDSVEHVFQAGRGEALSTVLESWAEVMPLEAFEWFREQMDSSAEFPRDHRLEYIVMFRELAASDREMAMSRLEGLPKPEDRALALKGILDASSGSGNRTLLLERMQRSENEELRKSGTSYLLNHWARYDPENAVDWAKQQLVEDDPENVQTMSRLHRQWIKKDPLTASEKLMETSDDSLIPELINDLVHSWPTRSLPRLEELLNSNTSHMDDGILTTLATRLVSVDPERSRHWVEQVANPSTKSSLIAMINRRTEQDQSLNYSTDPR